MVMPNELTDPADDVANGRKCRGGIDLGFAPLSEACNRMILRGIRHQMFERHPGVRPEKPLHGTALVHGGIFQDQD